MVERLSGGTATLLLVWLIGVGALSTLLAAWLYVWLVFGERLGVGAPVQRIRAVHGACRCFRTVCAVAGGARAGPHPGLVHAHRRKGRAGHGGHGARHHPPRDARHGRGRSRARRRAAWRGRSWWLPPWSLPSSGRWPPGRPTAGSPALEPSPDRRAGVRPRTRDRARRAPPRRRIPPTRRRSPRSRCR